MPAPAMTQHAGPRAVSAAAITAANAVCFYLLLGQLTKVPHILEPSTTPSDRTATGDQCQPGKLWGIEGQRAKAQPQLITEECVRCR